MRGILALVLTVAAWEVDLQADGAVKAAGDGVSDPAALLMSFAAGLSPLPAGWGGPGLCSSWAGVACDAGGDVRNLTLCAGGYSGTVNLTALPASLQRLALYSNNLSGTVDLSALPSSMEQVNLYHNRFSGTPDLSALPSGLRLLDLRSNSFSGGGQFTPSAGWCFTPQSSMCAGGLDGVFNCTEGSWACPSPPPTPPPLPTPPPPTPAPIPAPTPAPPSDAELLMKFAAQITPTPDGWGGPSLCSAWQGITCDGAGNVQKLDLEDGGFSGSVDLTALPSGLQALYLYNNEFSRTPDLTALPSSLQSLDLDSNKFSGTPDLSALPSGLQSFGLTSNEFSGTPDLSALPSGLQLLRLDSNKFSGTPDLSALPSGLSVFYMNDNDFQGSGSFPTPAVWCNGVWPTPGSQVCGSADASFDCNGGTWHCN